MLANDASQDVAVVGVRPWAAVHETCSGPKSVNRKWWRFGQPISGRIFFGIGWMISAEMCRLEPTQKKKFVVVVALSLGEVGGLACLDVVFEPRVDDSGRTRCRISDPIRQLDSC